MRKYIGVITILIFVFMIISCESTNKKKEGTDLSMFYDVEINNVSFKMPIQFRKVNEKKNLNQFDGYLNNDSINLLMIVNNYEIVKLDKEEYYNEWIKQMALRDSVFEILSYESNKNSIKSIIKKVDKSNNQLYVLIYILYRENKIIDVSCYFEKKKEFKAKSIFFNDFINKIN